MGFQGFLKQSTAVDVLIGPFVDSTDGDTEETALTIANTDVRLSKNGQTGAAKSDVTSCAHDADGFYNCELDATDTNTVGQLTLYVHVAGALAVRHDYHVVEEAIYDAMFGASAAGFDSNGRVDVGSWLGNAVTFGTGGPDVNVNAISDDTTAATNLESDYDGAGYNKSASTIGTTTTNTDMRGTDSALLASSAPTNFGDLSITVTTGRVDVASIEGSDATDQINAACDTALTDYDPPTKAELDSGLAGLNDPTSAAIADAVWDEAIAGHVGAGSTGEALDDATAPTAAAVADAVWDEAQSGHTTAGTFGRYLDAQVANVETDTQDIQSRLPAALVAGRMSADAVAISGSATAADNVEANIGNLDASIAGLNNLSSADVDTALTDIHLDHLFAAAYDATAKPGAADALLNEMVEDDGGVTRYTVNALENGPSGSGASAAAIADAVWDEARSGHTTAGSFGQGVASVQGNVTGDVQGGVDGNVGGSVQGNVEGSLLNNVNGTIGSLAAQAKADVNAEVDTALADIHLDHLLAADYDPASKPGTGTALLNELVENDGGVSRFTTNALEQAPGGGGDGSNLIAIPWNSAWDAEVQSEVQDAIEANHLDHLLAATYDATAKPGAADALLNEMVEDDAGVTRYTINALENGPSGSGASASAIADAVWDEAIADHQGAGSAGEALDNASAPTAAAVADAVWDEAIADHAGVGSTGEALDGTATATALTALQGTADDIETDTQNIQARIPLTLSGTRMRCDVEAISSDVTAANNLEQDYDGSGYAKANSTIGTCTTNTDMRGTDSAATATALATVDTNVDAILVDTDTTIPGLIAALNDLSAAEVNAQCDSAIADASLATAAALATVDTVVDAILVDTGTTLPASIAALNDLTAAQVNAEVVDALSTDTQTLPGQTAPPATPTIVQALLWLYKLARNKTTQTSSTFSLFDDAGSTVDAKATVSDDATTATKGELVSGP